MNEDCQKNIGSSFIVPEEELIAHRFRNGLIGMVCRSDFECWQRRRSIKTFLFPFLMYYGCIFIDGWSFSIEPGPRVTIPNKTLLRIFGISPSLQRRYQLESSEDALLIRRASQGEDNDCSWLCFDNGTEVPLQVLYEGQRIRVLGSPLAAPREKIGAAAYRAFAAGFILIRIANGIIKHS